MGISAEAMQLLLDFPWPGNVRELRTRWSTPPRRTTEPMVAAWHLVERLGAEGRPGRGAPIQGAAPVRDAEVILPSPPGGFSPIEEEIRELERTRMAQALAAANGNQTAAAELIKMPLRTFQAKAKVYGLRQKDRR